MTFSSDEVNYLIYRYLQESGFVHAAYSLSHESQLFSGPLVSSTLKNANIKGSDIHSAVPAGCLITLLQKALIYMEVEAHVDANGKEKSCNNPFSLIFPHNCKDKHSSHYHHHHKKQEAIVPTETATSSDSMTVLSGHQSEVFNCSWNPVKSVLASGSKDATSRLWEISDSLSASTNREIATLEHRLEDSLENLVVTTLDWTAKGNLLATGSYDGRTRIWDSEGQLLQQVSEHKGPVFALKWNPGGNLLLSGSVDKSIVAWDYENNCVKQVFECHTEPVLDVDWKDDISFASCSTDKLIQVCQMGSVQPVKTFLGHTDEVNTVKWDPNGILLASCSDDKTAKIWSMKHEKAVQNLSEHTEGIYTLRWSPVSDQFSVNLATASFDSTIKIWDVEHGRCLRTLSKHTEAVCSIAYSPDGKYLVSGSFDRYIRIWSVKDGSLVRSFLADGGVYEVSWNWTGTKIAGCTSNNTVCVIDFVM